MKTLLVKKTSKHSHGSVGELIDLLKEYAKEHGNEAKIAIPRIGSSFGEDAIINMGNISTILMSEGREIEW